MHLPAEGLTIMFISLDRTRILKRPLQRENKRGACLKICFLWGVSLLVVIPAGYTSIRYDPGRVGSYVKCNWVSSGVKFVEL